MNEFKEKILSYGCHDAGFSYIGEALAENICGSPDFKYAVSIVVKLSDAVIDGITDAPTHVYFHHYRTTVFPDSGRQRLRCAEDL